MTDATVPFWETNDWRPSQMAALVGRGISARRADELIEKQIKSYRARAVEEDAKDAAYDARG